MPARILYPGQPGESYAVAVRRLDGTYYDFAASAFVATPKQLTAPLKPDAAIPSMYALTIDPTPVATWPNGDYAAIVQTPGGLVVETIPFAMYGGDDQAPDWSKAVVQGFAAALAKVAAGA